MVAADGQAEIYVGRSEGSTTYYGCVYGRRRAVELGGPGEGCSSRGCSGIKHLTLAGTLVAYEEFQGEEHITGGPPGREEFLVVIRDLGTRHIVREIPTGTSPPPTATSQIVGNGFTTTIVLKSDGAVAWIVESGIEPSEYEVHAFDKSGSRLLASGRDIDPHSLALAGSTLYWTQGGKPFSTTLK